MFADDLLAIQIVLPLFGALVSVLFCSRFVWLWTLLVTFVGLLISVWFVEQTFIQEHVLSYRMGGWMAPYGIEYRVDRLSSFFLFLVSFIGFVTTLYAKESVKTEIDASKHGLFYGAFLLCLAGLLGITITHDVFNIYVFLEISSLATYVLIAMGKDRRALTAALEYLILGTVGATFILIAIGFLYISAGSLNISDLVSREIGLSDTMVVKAALAFFVIGLALKIALFPLHVWLTNAYTNAPSFVSSFLAATATKVSLYVIIRIVFMLFGVHYSFDLLSVDKALLLLGTLAMFFGSLAALYQENIKRMLAYSSVAQIGYIVVGIGLSSALALQASLMHTIAHAFAKAGLFMAVGAMAWRIGAVRMADLKGVGRIMPWTCVAFIITGLSLIGVPGTMGFISKWYLLQAIIEQEMWAVLVVMLLSSIMAVIYILKVLEVAYFGKTKLSTKEAPMTMQYAMWFIAILTVAYGLYPEPLIEGSVSVVREIMSW